MGCLISTASGHGFCPQPQDHAGERLYETILLSYTLFFFSLHLSQCACVCVCVCVCMRVCEAHMHIQLHVMYVPVHVQECAEVRGGRQVSVSALAVVPSAPGARNLHASPCFPTHRTQLSASHSVEASAHRSHVTTRQTG